MADIGSAEVVRRLVAAWQEGRVVSAAGCEGALADAEQAYRVQHGVGAALGWFGAAPPRVWKSGGGSRERPLTHAPLPDAGVRASPGDLRDLRFHRRGIEAEIALRVGAAVSPKQAAKLTPEAALALVDAMAVSIEVVDSRWLEASAAPALLRMADLASHGALVLGDWQPFAARDWATQACTVRVGTQPPVVRVGSYPLADPVWLLTQWLRHVTRHGETLAAGSVVTTGSWVGLLNADAGDAVSVEFDAIGAASLQL